MNAGIFQSVGHALAVSYLIGSLPPQQGSSMRRALIRMLECVELPTRLHRDWLDQLRGTTSGTVDFSGLTSDEIRAQCAMVTQTVRDHLPEPEMWVVQARYIQTECEDLGDGRKRYYFSQERVDAIKGLSTWLSPSYSGVAPLAIDCMVAKLFANHAKVEISFRDLAATFGASHMTYSRAFAGIKARLRGLELVAVGRLEPFFVETGLIESTSQAEATGVH